MQECTVPWHTILSVASDRPVCVCACACVCVYVRVRVCVCACVRCKSRVEGRNGVEGVRVDWRIEQKQTLSDRYQSRIGENERPANKRKDERNRMREYQCL